MCVCVCVFGFGGGIGRGGEGRGGGRRVLKCIFCVSNLKYAHVLRNNKNFSI